MGSLLFSEGPLQFSEGKNRFFIASLRCLWASLQRSRASLLASTMLYLGNFFSTRAPVQTNVFLGQKNLYKNKIGKKTVFRDFFFCF